MKFFVFLLQLLTLTLSDYGSNCVDNYLYFEEQTFDNNSENRVKLYQAFYPPNDHLPYSVVVRLFFPMELESTSPLTPAALTDKCGCGCPLLFCSLWVRSYKLNWITYLCMPSTTSLSGFFHIIPLQHLYLVQPKLKNSSH